jgi:secretion/DNA translocation related CpaE-like protein
MLCDAAEGAAGGGQLIAVVGGRGGAGASVFASALAVQAALRVGRVLLVDCDPLAGGLDLLLGIEHVDGLRWPDLPATGGRVPAGALHGALPAVSLPPASSGQLTVLSCGRAGEQPLAAALESVLDAGLRSGDTVVCDLPRHLPAGVLEVLRRADLVTLVVPAEVRAIAAALPLAGRLLEFGRPVAAVVRGPSPGGLLPADLMGALPVPVLASMRPAPRLAEALERGRLPFLSSRGPLAVAAQTVLDALGAGSVDASLVEP